MGQKTQPKPEPAKVSTMELFFDLVFVFTITQLTHLVDQSQGPLDLFCSFLILSLIWWIYAGYAWLVGSTGAQGGMRFVLLGAMAGFLVMALALPSFLKEGGAAFGLAYLLVICIHSGSFAYRGSRGALGRRAALGAVLGIFTINAAVAVLIIAAGLAPPAWRWAFLLAGAGMFVLSTLLRRERNFSVQPGHFAERHGLVILIALGESVLGIGTGASQQALDLGSIVTMILSLGLVAGLWWAYFGGDDARAEQHLVDASPSVRSRMALLGYWYAHLVMIAGIVLVATGVKRVVGQQASGFQASAWLLAGGLALYLLGGALFRRIMGIRPVLPRVAAGLLCLLLAAAWPASEGWLGLGAGVLLLTALFSLERAKPGKMD